MMSKVPPVNTTRLLPLSFCRLSRALLSKNFLIHGPWSGHVGLRFGAFDRHCRYSDIDPSSFSSSDFIFAICGSWPNLWAASSDFRYIFPAASGSCRSSSTMPRLLQAFAVDGPSPWVFSKLNGSLHQCSGLIQTAGTAEEDPIAHEGLLIGRVR